MIFNYSNICLNIKYTVITFPININTDAKEDLLGDIPSSIPIPRDPFYHQHLFFYLLTYFLVIYKTQSLFHLKL